jgi:hypothetical protein
MEQVSRSPIIKASLSAPYAVVPLLQRSAWKILNLLLSETEHRRVVMALRLYKRLNASVNLLVDLCWITRSCSPQFQ